MVQGIAGGYQLKTRPEFSVWTNKLFDQPKAPRLSQPALETLAVIAYRQPIGRAEIESVRGVAVDGVVATLLERKRAVIGAVTDGRVSDEEGVVDALVRELRGAPYRHLQAVA